MEKSVDVCFAPEDVRFLRPDGKPWRPGDELRAHHFEVSGAVLKRNGIAGYMVKRVTITMDYEKVGLPTMTIVYDPAIPPPADPGTFSRRFRG